MGDWTDPGFQSHIVVGHVEVGDKDIKTHKKREPWKGHRDPVREPEETRKT